MADARALLRQQREARRVAHPHAVYSEAGKLSCSLCQESVRAEGLWESHVKGSSHKQRVLAVEASSRNGEVVVGGKRKHVEEDEDAMEDADEVVRKKRSKTDIATSGLAPLATNGVEKYRKDQNFTPPSAGTPPGRRQSVTPAQGVEINMPSRPATPAAPRESPSSSTPAGPSPMIAPPEMTVPPTQKLGPDVDEAEWAAFSAEIAAVTAPVADDAVISAPAMTAEESAAAKRMEEEEKDRRTKADADIVDEKEDATRQMEDEFEEMAELEQRVRRLKEKREALRRNSVAAEAASKPVMAGKENSFQSGEGDEVQADGDGDEDEDEDVDEDDWATFRIQS